MNKLHVVLSAIGIVLSLGMTACLGAPQGEDEFEVSSAHLDNGGYTTRTICTSCGCVADMTSCNCGMPPRDYKLCCLEQEGDRTGCGYPARAGSYSGSFSASSSDAFSR